MSSKLICALLVSQSLAAVSTKTAPHNKLVLRQDLTPAELLAIDIENLNSPYNAKFKIPMHEAHTIRTQQHKEWH